MSLSPTDMQVPFDPTAYTTITGAQLKQLVAGAFPNTDHGMVLVTTDAPNGDPDVPDARTGQGNEKWQNYLWIRQSSTSISAYVWNTNGAVTTAPYYGWTSINVAGIGYQSITGDKIYPGTLGDTQIGSLSGSKIVGALSPSASANFVTLTAKPAEGDLTDSTFNTLAVKGLAINSAKLAEGAVTTTKISDKNVTVEKLLGSGSAAQMIRVTAADTTVCEFFTPNKIVTTLADPISTDANKIVAVNGTYDGFAYVTLPSAGAPATGINIIAKNNVATPATKIDLSADYVLLVNGSGVPRIVTNLSCTIDGATNGAVNRLDTGTLTGNNWYYFWAISNGTTDGGLLSASATVGGLTLPSGYTYTALIGAVRYRSSGSTFVNFYQVGRQVYMQHIGLFTGGVATAANTLQVFTNAIAGGGTITNALDAVIPPMAKSMQGFIGSTTGQHSYMNISANSTGSIGYCDGYAYAIASHTPTASPYTWGAAIAYNLPIITAQTIYWASVDNTTARNQMSVTGFTI